MNQEINQNDNENSIIFENEYYFPIKHVSCLSKDLVISESGKILNKKTKKFRKIKPDGNFVAYRTKSINVGRIVALTFLTGDNETNLEISKKRVKHIDGNNANNHINNLKWQ